MSLLRKVEKASDLELVGDLFLELPLFICFFTTDK